MKDELRLEKDVEESQPEQGGETADQGSAQEEILAIGSEQGSSGEGGEDHGRHQEGIGNDGRVDVHGEVQDGSGAESGQEGEPEEHGESEATVLSGVRSAVEGEDESESDESEEKSSSAKEIGEEVDVGSGRSRQDAHGQAGVHALQVSAHRGLPKIKKIKVIRFNSFAKLCTCSTSIQGKTCIINL